MSKTFQYSLPLFLIAASGCVSYSPKPVNMDSVRRAFAERAVTPPLATVNTAAGPPFDLADGLSVSEAEGLALVFNTDLRAARAIAGVSLANAENAGRWADPTFGVDLTRILASVDEPWELGIPVGLTLPISGRLRAEKKLAGAEHDAELVRVFADEWSTRIRVRVLWARWAAATDRAQSLRDFVGRYSEVSTVIDALESSGEMPRTEARLFRLDDVTRRAELVAAEAGIEAARLEILATIGLPPVSGIVMVHESLVAATNTTTSGSASGLDRAFAQNTSLAVARAEYEVSERRLATEVRAQYPDLTLTGGYGNEDGNDRIITGVGTVLPLWNRNRQGVARASAMREAASIRLEAAAERLEGEYAAAIAAASAADRERDLIEGGLLPLVEQQVTDIRAVTRLGEVNALVLLETLSRRLEADLSRARAKEAAAIGQLRVIEIEGPPTEPDPQPEPGASTAVLPPVDNG